MAAKTQSPTAVVKREIEPIGQGSLLQTSPTDASLKEIASAYAILSFLEKVIEKRKSELKPRLQEESKTGLLLENGGHSLDLGDAKVVNTRRLSAAPEDQPLKSLMETRGVALLEAFDEVKSLVLNPSKLAYLIEVGKLDKKEVESLRKETFALSVAPSKELQDALLEACAVETPKEKSSKRERR
jgi:hypothetical protein